MKDFKDLVILSDNGVSVEAYNKKIIPSDLLTTTEYRKYSIPSNKQAITQLIFLFICYLILCYFYSNNYIFLSIITLIYTLHYTLNLAHECWHNIFFKNFFWNNFFGIILSAIVGLPYRYAKKIHFNHHKYLNQSKDPGYVYTNANLSKKDIILSLLGILVLKNQVKNIIAVYELIKNKFFNKNKVFYKPKNNNNGLILKDIFYLFLIHIIILNFFILRSSIFPFIAYEYAVISLLPFVDAVRTLIDHKKNIGEDSTGYTRNFKISFLDKVITKPYFDWHLLHHYFPQIPQQNLPKLEKIIISKIDKTEYYNSNSGNSISALFESLRNNDYKNKFI